MKPEKIKLCVFDMAGTLVKDNNIVQKIFIKSFKHQNLKVDPLAVNIVMGYEKKYAIRQLLETAIPIKTIAPIHRNKTNGKSVLSQKMVSDIYRTFNQSMIEYYEEHAQPVAYAHSALKKIKALGIKIAVNTGFGKEIMLTIINTLHWQDFIDVCISSDQVSEGRPQPYMIEVLKKRVHVMSSTEVAKIGDTPSDLLEGNNAGCTLNIGIYSKNFPLEEMKKYPHSHLVSNLKAAAAIVLSYNASV